MRLATTIYVTIIFQFIFLNGIAQQFVLKFNLVEGPEGKPLGKIRNMTQDPNGYMWFAGEGEHCIYRYDGNRMLIFRHDDANPNSLGETSINSVYADDSGIIWIGMSSGLDQFNPATGIFTHFRNTPGDPNSLSGEIIPVIKDRHGRVWVGGTDGLFLLDQKTGKFKHFLNEPGNNKSLSDNQVETIYEDRQGEIWIGTGYPWFERGKDGKGGLNRFNIDGSFTRYLHDPNDRYSLINNKIAAILEDSRGVFWVGTSGDGLHTMDRKTGRFERHQYDPAQPDKLSRTPEKPQGDITDKITFIVEDSSGSIWIGTRSSGITRYETGTKKISRFEASNGFPDHTSWNAFTSREGELWITTEQNHLFRVDPFSRSISSFPTTDQSLCFLEDAQQHLWVGTKQGGLLEYDEHKNLINTYKHDSTHNLMICLFQKSKDSIWMGTPRGIFVISKQSGKISPWPHNGKLMESEGWAINLIFRDKRGSIWFSRWNGGMVRYDPRDNTFKRYVANANDSTSLSTNAVTDIMEDRVGNLWISGLGRFGIRKLINGTDHFRHYLPGNYSWDLYEDSEGGLWAGTDKGLYRYSKEDDKFLPFFDQQSQLSAEQIRAIIEDNQRNLWVTTRSEIVKINPSRTEVLTFNSKFGIAPNSLPLQLQSIYQTINGQILVGHDKGFYAFFPQELVINASASKIKVTDFYVNSLPVIPGKESILQEPIGEAEKIKLKHDQNNLSFDFSVLDYREPESIKYYSMLENYDDVWRHATGEKSSFYFNVPPGDYVGSPGTELEFAL